MALFEQFPYSNFHELNLDWIIEKVKEYLKKYDSIDAAQKALEADFDDLKTYVINYLETADFENLVDEKLNEMLNNGDFDAIFEEYVVPKINELIEVYKNIPNLTPAMNLVKTIFRGMVDNVSGYLSGACGLNNGKCAIAFNSAISNNAIIAVYDIDTWAIEREAVLPLRHANALTYNPQNNMIFVSGTTSYDNLSYWQPDVFVVDASTLTIVETKTPPLPEYTTGLCSMQFDIEKNVFYAVGATAGNYGEYNTVLTYNADLTEIVDRKILSAWTVKGAQGLVYARNGVIYVLYGGIYYYQIMAINIADDEILKIWNIKKISNGYRAISEPESLIFDERNSDFYLCSRYFNAGVKGKEATSILKIGLFKPLIEFNIGNGTYGWNDVGRITTYVYQGDTTTLTTNINRFCCIGDAICAARENNLYLQIGFGSQNNEIDDIDIIDFNGIISGAWDNRIKLTRVRFINSNVRFAYCDFEGSQTAQDTGAACSLSFAKSTLEFTATTAANGISGVDSILYNTASIVMNVQRCIVLSASAAPETGSVLTQSVFLQHYS